MDTHHLGDRVFGLIEAEPGAPLLLYLHGSTQTIADAREFSRRMFERIGAHLIYPQGVGGVFNDFRGTNPGVDDVAFLRTVIEWAALRLDPPAVTGVGFSNGGHMLIRLLHEAPGLLDAVTLMGTTLPVSFARSGAAPTPVQIIHGVEDPVAPIGGGAVGIGSIQRGRAVSAAATAEYFRHINGGAPVELIEVAGLGHLVAGGAASPGLGPQQSAVTAAEEVRRFHSAALA